jgi:DNA-binding MarR family transcriptional regulator
MTIRHVSAFVGLEEQAALAVARVADQLSERAAGLMAGRNVAPEHYRVLRALRAAGREGLTAGEVADLMAASPPDASRLIDRLEGDGRALRSRDGTDRRVVRVVITEGGRRVLAELDLPLAALYRRQFGQLGADRIRELIDTLTRVRS